MKEYKVVVVQPDQDQCLTDAQNLENALNAYRKKGWKFVTFTPDPKNEGFFLCVFKKEIEE
ncbi:MAG: hypothetical protein ACOY35_14565 [Bacillota bacterium]|nr:DUF4177 domain-containing protein [Bacillota bacterium]